MCCVARIPIFFLGSFLASNRFWVLESIKFNLILFCLGILSLLPFYWNNNLSGNNGFTTYYCFILIIPGFTYFLGRLCCMLPDLLRKFLFFTGKISLELYLIHVTIMPWLMQKMSGFGLGDFFCVVIPLLVSYLMAYLLFYTVKQVANLNLQRVWS